MKTMLLFLNHDFLFEKRVVFMAGGEKPTDAPPPAPKQKLEDTYKNPTERKKAYQDVIQGADNLMNNPDLKGEKAQELRARIQALKDKVSATDKIDKGQNIDGTGDSIGYNQDAAFFKRQIGRLQKEAALFISAQAASKDSDDADSLIRQFDALPKPDLFSNQAVSKKTGNESKKS